MTFQMAFHKYSSYLQDKLRTHTSSREYVVEELSFKMPDGSWKLVGPLDTIVARVWPDGSVDLSPAGC